VYVSFCALAAHRFVAHLMLGVLLCARVVFVAATSLIPTWIRPRVCTVGQAGRPVARSRPACRRRVPGRSSAPGGRWRRAGPSRGRMACPGPVEPRARKFEAKRVVPRGPGASRWLSAKDDSSFTRESYGVSRNRSPCMHLAAEDESRLLIAVTAPKIVDVGGGSDGEGFATISFKTGPNLVSYDYTVSCYERDLSVPTTSCNAIADEDYPTAGNSVSGETGKAYDKITATVTGLGTSLVSSCSQPALIFLISGGVARLFAWSFALPGLLLCLVFCFAWSFALPGLLLCLVFCFAWSFALPGSPWPSPHSLFLHLPPPSDGDAAYDCFI
jgi:hypothetical protein